MKNGKSVAVLGYGALRMPTIDGGHANKQDSDGYSESTIDATLLQRQVSYMLTHGINYFDTAPNYCRGESEARLGAAIAGSRVRRENIILATKLSNFEPQQHSLDACKAMFEQSLKNLRTDYIDNYVLDDVGVGGFETFQKRFLDNGALGWIADMRTSGLVKGLGFSYDGDQKAFEWCLEHHSEYKWDFCQIRMNYVDWQHAKEVRNYSINAKDLYERLTDLEIPVIVMDPLLGERLARKNYALSKMLGPLAADTTLAMWAFRFCGTFPNVLTILPGMTKMENIVENVKTCSPLLPCNARALEVLERAAQALLALHTIPCTVCGNCVPCPFGIDIPSILTFRNKVITKERPPTTRQTLEMYEAVVPDRLRRAEYCTGCDKCLASCPEKINISDELASIDKWVDSLIEEELD